MRSIAGVNLYTVSETAKELGITPQTVRAYVKKGKLEGERVGRPILITEASIKALLKSSKVETAIEPQTDEERVELIESWVKLLEEETRERLLYYLFRKYEISSGLLAESKQ